MSKYHFSFLECSLVWRHRSTIAPAVGYMNLMWKKMSAKSPETTQYVACMLLMWGQIDYIVGGSYGLMTHNDIGSECPSAMTSRILYMPYFVYDETFHQDYSVEESRIHFRFIF